MTRVTITPAAFHPAVTIDRAARLAAIRDTISAAGDPFGSGLELWALAADVAGKPLAAAARVPHAWQARLIARIARARRHHRGPRHTRFDSAAATVLLDLFEGARGQGAIARAAFAEYAAILDRTAACQLRESMAVNLDRVRHLLDDHGRAVLARAWARIAPATPPYARWFAGGRAEIRLVCQVQDVFFRSWKGFLKKLGFAVVAQSSPGRIHYRRTDVVRGVATTFHIDYREKGEGIFSAMADADVDGVLFLGHSDWWARVPRNLADAPDQRGAKLLVLLMCFGKHFHHALHTRYPDAHIVTTKDPTEDPEDVAMLRHLLEGIAHRQSWRAIRAAAVADAKTADNFIFPGDVRYIVGVSDDDRDGRLDRFDRFCNLGSGRLLAPPDLEDSFVPDPPGLHPRGVELAPRELDGAKILEAALMLNSLSYDNQLLDQVNIEQKVVASGWHVPRPGDFRAARFAIGRRDGREIVRLSCSVRYARAAPSALTAMVVYEGYQFFALRLRGRPRLDAVDHALMGLMLVGHALANADYPQHEAVFRAFVRRYGFPARLPLKRVLHHIEADPAWESGSRRAVRALRRDLDDAQLARLERVLDA
jgi:hypothetical protein